MSKAAELSVFDVVAPEKPLEKYSIDREFIVVRKADDTVTVKDFFSGRQVTTSKKAFRVLRKGTNDEISFAQMPW